MALKRLAQERIALLLSRARSTYKLNQGLSRRYVELAKRLSMKAKVPMPAQDRYLLCRKCKSVLISGLNCRIRIRSEKGTTVVVTCLNCGHIKRYPTVKEKRRGPLSQDGF